MRILFALAVAGLAAGPNIAAADSGMKLVPVQDTGQKVIYSQGEGYVEITRGDMTAMIGAVPGMVSSKRVAFAVSLGNHSATAIDIDPDHVTAEAGDMKAVLEPVPYERLVAEIEREVGGAKVSGFLSALGGALGQAGAEMQANERADTYGYRSLGDQVEIERQRRNAEAANQEATAFVNRAQYEAERQIEKYLRRHTIQPGASHAGIVVMKAPKLKKKAPQDITVTLNTADGEIYAAVFRYGPWK